MYPHQAERLEHARTRAGAEALIAAAPENVAYLTGYWSTSCALDPTLEVYAVYAPAGTALIVPAHDVPSVVSADVDTRHLACYGEAGVELTETDAGRAVRSVIGRAAASPAGALARALDALGVRRGVAGLDDARLPAAAAGAIRQSLRGLTVRPATDALATARLVKGPYEIECLQAALHIAEEAIQAVLDQLRPGVSERDAVTLYERAVTRKEAAPGRTIIAAAHHAAEPAAWPSDRRVRAGDVIRFDVGAVLNGYHARVARTAVMGEPTARDQAHYDALVAGVEAGLAVVAPAVDAGAVHAAAVAAPRERGLPDYRRSHAGHGLGLAAAEAPWLSPGSAALETGMVVNVALPYYALGDVGMGVSETAIVAQRGSVVMNRSHRSLVILD